MLFRVSTNSLYTCILKDLAHLQPSCSNSGAVPRRGRSKEKFPPEANELEEKKILHYISSQTPQKSIAQGDTSLLLILAFGELIIMPPKGRRK